MRWGQDSQGGQPPQSGSRSGEAAAAAGDCCPHPADATACRAAATVHAGRHTGGGAQLADSQCAQARPRACGNRQSGIGADSAAAAHAARSGAAEPISVDQPRTAVALLLQIFPFVEHLGLWHVWLPLFHAAEKPWLAAHSRLQARLVNRLGQLHRLQGRSVAPSVIIRKRK